MRFWVSREPGASSRRGSRARRDVAHLVDEGVLVARSALRLAVKNRIILSAVRDARAWDEEAIAAMARDEVARLAEELSLTADRLAADSLRAAPRRRWPRAQSVRDRAEAERLTARSLTIRPVSERLRELGDDPAFVRELVARARDDTLGELTQARLIPPRPQDELSEEEERTAIEAVKTDLQAMLADYEERTSGYAENW